MVKTLPSVKISSAKILLSVKKFVGENIVVGKKFRRDSFSSPSQNFHHFLPTMFSLITDFVVCQTIRRGGGGGGGGGGYRHHL